MACRPERVRRLRRPLAGRRAFRPVADVALADAGRESIEHWGYIVDRHRPLPAGLHFLADGPDQPSCLPNFEKVRNAYTGRLAGGHGGAVGGAGG